MLDMFQEKIQKNISEMLQEFSKNFEGKIEIKIKGMLQDFAKDLNANLDKKISDRLENFAKDINTNLDKKISDRLENFAKDLNDQIDIKITEKFKKLESKQDEKFANIIDKLNQQNERITKLEHNSKSLISIQVSCLEEMTRKIKAMDSDVRDNSDQPRNNNNNDCEDDDKDE